jgi:RNA polymerase sigma-70 factor (ECF subfamily)
LPIELDEEAARLRHALNQLSSRQAEVLHLVFYQELPLTAVADVIGISVGSVRQHYERGKARLRELLTAASHDERTR